MSVGACCRVRIAVLRSVLTLKTAASTASKHPKDPTMRETSNLRVVDTDLLLSPDQVTDELPLSARSASTVYRARKEIEAIVQGHDSRLLVIVGPCSIHDPDAALDYARRLIELRNVVSQQ